MDIYYITPFTDIFVLIFKYMYDETSVQYMEFTFWCDLFKVLSLKHVQCSWICLNGGVSFITFHVHVYKIL